MTLAHAARRHSSAGALVAAALGCCAFAPAAHAADLVHLAVNQPAGEGGGKPLVMEFAEVERTELQSVVEVKYVSGASVPSSMFALGGMCAVARARGAAYFRTAPLPGMPQRHVVTFLTEKPATGPVVAGKPNPDAVISLADCALLGM